MWGFLVDVSASTFGLLGLIFIGGMLCLFLKEVGEVICGCLADLADIVGNWISPPPKKETIFWRFLLMACGSIGTFCLFSIRWYLPIIVFVVWVSIVVYRELTDDGEDAKVVPLPLPK